MEGGGWVGAVEDRSGLDAREKKFPEILFVFLSTHHSDQMSEGSQSSKVNLKVTLCDGQSLTYSPRVGSQSCQVSRN